MERTGDERSNRRFPYYSTIGYVESRGKGNRILNGLTINRSIRGLCLFIFHPLDKGEKIVITNDSQNAVSAQTGTVIWVKEINKEMFKVGLNLCTES